MEVGRTVACRLTQRTTDQPSGDSFDTHLSTIHVPKQKEIRTMMTQPPGVHSCTFGGIAVAFSPDATFGAEEPITFMRGSLIPNHGDIAFTATGANAPAEMRTI